MANDPYYGSITDQRISLLGAFSLENSNECRLNFKQHSVVDRLIIDEIYLLIKNKSSLINKIIISNVKNISDKDLQHMKRQFKSIPEVKEIIFI